MSLFAWNAKYSVNIKEIDDQHKKLIGMVGQLNDAMRQGKGKEILDRLLQDLVQYTRTHFAAEERVMKAHGYPEFEDHKAKHDKMTQKVLEVQRGYREGKLSITIELMAFLEKWVDQHIMVTDRKYAPFLNGKGVS